MSKELTREELGLPLKKRGRFIDDANGYLIAEYHSSKLEERLDFIILAANNYHALVEALENYGSHFEYCNLQSPIPCTVRNGKPVGCTCGFDKVEALLATHTQEETPNGS